MARTKSDKPRLRDLPKETQLEIKRAKAKKLAEEVKIADAKAAADQHQATIDNLTKG